MLERIRQRKLWQWVVAYAVAAYGGLQAVDLVAEPWGLSPFVVRSLQILAAAGCLVTVVLAWYHGERGRQRVSRSELVWLALLLLLTAGAVGMARTDPPGPPGDAAASPIASGLIRVAVLPTDPFAGADSASTDALVQQLFIIELASRRGLAVSDRLSMSTVLRRDGRPAVEEAYARLGEDGVDYVVRTAVTLSATGIAARYWLVEPGTGDVAEAGSFAAKGEEDLPEKVSAAASDLVAAMERAEGSLGRRPDLAPWVRSHAIDAAAVREFLQGTAYSYRGLAGGSEHFRRALDIDPTFVAPRVWLVSGLAGEGDTVEVAAHVRILRSLEPRATPFEQAMIGWAEAVARGDLEAKARHLQVALSYSPGNNVLLFNLAGTLWSLRRHAEAMEALRPCVDARWPFSTLYVLWGLLSIEAGEVAGLRSALEFGLTTTPHEDLPYLDGLLQALAVFEGDDAAAARHGAAFARAVEEEQASYAQMAFVYRTLGSLARERGTRETALALLQHAADADPSDPAAQLDLARVLAETGRRDQALELFAEAMEDPTQDPQLLYLRGDVAAALGRRGEAVALFEKYLQVAPQGPAAPVVRERLRALGGGKGG